MNVYKYLILFFLISLGSCGVEEYDDTQIIKIDVDDPEIVIINDMMSRSISLSANNGQQIGCITIKYPFEVVTSDSQSYLINDNATFDTLSNNNSSTIVDFIYPLEIIDQLGLDQNVNDLWELAGYFAGCFPESLDTTNNLFQAYVINFQNSCYEIKYPIEVFNDKGVQFVVKKEDELIVKLAEESVYFQFPFELITQNGTNRTVQTSEDLETSLIACNGLFADTLFNCLSCFDYLGCYKLIYPLQIMVLQQSNPYTVQDATQMSKIYAQGRFLDFTYPLTVLKQDSQLVVLHNSDELLGALVDCYLKGDFYFLMIGTSLISQPACYELVFPIEASHPNGQVQAFNNLQEIQPLLQDSILFEYKLKYPIDVNILKGNEKRKLSTFIDIQDLLSECEG